MKCAGYRAKMEHMRRQKFVANMQIIHQNFILDVQIQKRHKGYAYSLG
jgi:hypothetical protein